MEKRMNKKVTLIYPFDPLGKKVGGVETFIKGFIKYAPSQLDIEHIGITTSLSERAPNVWQRINIGTTNFRFYPIFHENDENKKTIIPLSLRFTLGLTRMKPDLSGRILVLNRLEPCLAFLRSNHRKIGFVHNDIQKQLARGSDSFWKYMPSLYFFFEKKILTSLDHVYTVSTRTLDFYNRRHPQISDKVSFLPTWVDQEIFYIADEAKNSIRRELVDISKVSPENTWILFVGRLQEQKAPLRLVEVFHEYVKLKPRSTLLIIGEGNLKKVMQQKARELGVYSDIHFLGVRTQDELARFCQASDVLTLTSNYEGMPRCCLEALGCGLPVVSTDVGEVSRVVLNGFSGEVVDNYAPDSIARAINKIVADPNKYRKENCLASVAEYRPKTVLAQVYELIRNL